MKKISTIIAVFAFVITLSMAQTSFAHWGERHHNSYTSNYNGGYNNHTYRNLGGGYVENNNANFTTVANAKKMNDDSYVKLKGKIVSKIGNEKYLFEDNTGSIQIEIDDDKWGGIQVNAQDTVVIEGEVDKDWKSISIDVDRVTLLRI